MAKLEVAGAILDRVLALRKASVSAASPSDRAAR
jgi:hypothetical protein